jgi:hypothetical protein
VERAAVHRNSTPKPGAKATKTMGRNKVLND